MTVATLAANGATFLDEQIPDWYTIVNPATLDIGRSDNCVVGQLFGSYWNGISKLNLLCDSPGEDAYAKRVSYGFSVMGVWQSGLMESLNDAWREEIAARRLKDYATQEAPALVAVN